MSMKIFERLVRLIYSVERRSSAKQLSDDFGHFPPAPLRCEGVSGKFEVVRIRGIGVIYSELIMINMMFRGIESDAQPLSADFKDFFGVEEMLVLRQVFDSIGHRAKFIKPLLIPILLGVMCIKLIVRKIRYAHKKSMGLGYFLPIRENEKRIIVKIAGHERNGRSEEPTISHEHVHFLQHKDSEEHARDAKSPETFLTQKGLVEPFLLYLLQKNEVEARLHESVLSFYRFHRRIPVTLSSFLGMLAAGQQFGEFVTLILKRFAISFDHEVEIYPERDSMYAEQLEYIFVFIQTPEQSCRFITEVLPVMYGNLLRYYGDKIVSRDFLKAIARPNFYDELYGL